MTDQGHGGFAFFAHRHCPARHGSTLSARSARRVREKSTRSWPQISNRAKGSRFLHIAPAQRRRVRLFRLGAREGFEKKHAELAAAPEGSKFQVGAMTNRKIKECLGLEKSISKKDFQFKKYNFSPPAPNCTFERSGARRVRVFCTSSGPATQGSTIRLGVREGFKKKVPGAGRGTRWFGISVTESTDQLESGPRFEAPFLK